MNPSKLGVAAGIACGLVLVAAAAMYFLNPFHTASADWRARVLGTTLYRIPSENMRPTLLPDQIIWVSTANLAGRDPARGEIVVFQYPPVPEIHFIKRIIALGGDTVELRAGVVWVNGSPLKEPYLAVPPIVPDRNDTMAPVRVPETNYFVLGDNRGNSMDSRHWGFVPRDHIVGVYEPPEK